MIWLLAVILLLSILLNCAQWFERQVLTNTISKLHKLYHVNALEPNPIGFEQ